jgi:hypothetical protein
MLGSYAQSPITESRIKFRNIRGWGVNGDFFNTKINVALRILFGVCGDSALHK